MFKNNKILLGFQICSCAWSLLSTTHRNWRWCIPLPGTFIQWLPKVEAQAKWRKSVRLTSPSVFYIVHTTQIVLHANSFFTLVFLYQSSHWLMLMSLSMSFSQRITLVILLCLDSGKGTATWFWCKLLLESLFFPFPVNLVQYLYASKVFCL